MSRLIVAITGASGVCYGIRLVQTLMEQRMPVALTISETGRIVIGEEMGIKLENYTRPESFKPLLGKGCEEFLEVYSPKDFTAPIASGSYDSKGMVIVPSTMGTVGAVANGMSQNLIHRAAECMLKEGRKLVIVPRETPFSLIHLENLTRLARAGARIVPASPGFYSNPQSMQDIVDFMVGKILDQFEIPHMLYPRWTGLGGHLTQSKKTGGPEWGL